MVLVKGLRPPSLFLAGGGSELEGLEDEDGREALSWVVRALGRPDLKIKKLQTTKIYFLIGLKDYDPRSSDLRRVGLLERGARSGHDPPPLESLPRNVLKISIKRYFDVSSPCSVQAIA